MPEHDSRTPDKDGASPRTSDDRAEHSHQTRFGPRPTPEGHREPRGPSESRFVPPSGNVSPDGRRHWPAPSSRARLLAWGGTAIAAAAVTAGAVYAGRAVAGALRGDDSPAPPPSQKPAERASAPQSAPPHEPSRPPRFVDLAEEDRAALRKRARALQEARAQARARSAGDDEEAPCAKAAKRSFTADVEDKTAKMHRSVENTMHSISSAVSGFRNVAGQAGSIMREFNDVAALLGSFIGDKAKAAQQHVRETAEDVTEEAKSRRDDLVKAADKTRREHNL